MKTNAGLKAATVQYAKTRPVFEQYKACLLYTSGLKRDYEKLWGEVSKVLRELSELVAK